MKKTNHDANVKTVVDAFNSLLNECGLAAGREPIGTDRNIYKQTTEIVFGLGDESVLQLDIPDIWLNAEERGLPDEKRLVGYLGSIIAANLISLSFDPTRRIRHQEQEPCKCGCCHVPDHGACPEAEYEKGANGRCVYCDHGYDCHEAHPIQYNTPLGVEHRHRQDKS